MRTNRTLEIGTGLFVLLGFAALFFLSAQLPENGLHLSSAKVGYEVTAEFDNIGDLRSGAPVTMAGVRIGDVQGIRIDPQDYRALVTLRINPQYSQIPDDSDASIDTQGLLGGQYIAIGVGGSDTFLKSGSRIQFTQPAIVLENLVNKLVASFGGKSSDSSSSSSSSSSAGRSSGSGASSSASGTNAGSRAPAAQHEESPR
jgi:phospholipid/cholesterol/gamma-HCH transport system substrate-binding protein